MHYFNPSRSSRNSAQDASDYREAGTYRVALIFEIMNKELSNDMFLICTLMPGYGFCR